MLVAVYETLGNVMFPIINIILLALYLAIRLTDGTLDSSSIKKLAGIGVAIIVLGAFAYLGFTGTNILLFNLVVLFIDGIWFIVSLTQYMMSIGSQEELEQNSNENSSSILDKKYASAGFGGINGFMVSSVGWALSIGVILAFMEFPQFEEQALMDLGNLEAEAEEQIEVPQTFVKPPPPPKVTIPQIVEVPDEAEIEEEIEIELPEFDEEFEMEEVVEDFETEEEAVDEIFEIVEDPASYQGGTTAFLKWVGKNMKYPSQARRMGVEGKVYVQFVVDKDGSLIDVKTVRGIGAGCDEEAERVIRKSMKWKPGKQRGRAVKQKMVLPINFKLS
ncbi:energy transducer TonB [Sediminitomix flava]|uniref:TonB family protein n=1 Tax=Sediminitomix flava TaxID=379075 RepID=A0A315ZI43_SEDFL|nr:energy transducer TonB [Sediminitomix flava]PWJ44488.1 TonB family protein [Sediminitomix flava]